MEELLSSDLSKATFSHGLNVPEWFCLLDELDLLGVSILINQRLMHQLSCLTSVL